MINLPDNFKHWIHCRAVVKAEILLFVGNCFFALASDWMTQPVTVFFILLVMAIYRLFLFIGLNAGSLWASWWYCVVASFSVIRFIVLLFGAPGISPLDVGNSKNSIHPLGLVFILAVLAVRIPGAFQVFWINLSPAGKVSAGVVILAGALAAPQLHMGIILLSAFDVWLYGINIALH